MPATTAGTTPPSCTRPWKGPTVTATTTTPAIPILLNISNHAGFGVEWMMPDTGGTTMQLMNPRGTSYLLFGLRTPSSVDWLTVSVITPQRFGLRAPATNFDEFMPVAHTFIAAIHQTTAATGATTDDAGYPRIPAPRDPNESYRRQAAEQASPPAGRVLSRLARLRPHRRPSGRHRLLKRRARSYRPTAPLARVAWGVTAA